MGDCKAYLNCACDALSGKVKLDMGLPRPDEHLPPPRLLHKALDPALPVGEDQAVLQRALVAAEP